MTDSGEGVKSQMVTPADRGVEKPDSAARLRATLASVAPGTVLREGLERILRGRTGALIVVGHDRQIEAISTGGFRLDVPFTATGLRELAKMDGAIILDKDASRILMAGVHLMPDPSIFTEESGTRHRTADRVARQTSVPVISVSASMHIIALYQDDLRRVLEETAAVLGRANQALQTLERYRNRLDEVSDALVGAGDRGPRHGSRCRGCGPATRDGQPYRRRDRHVRSRARH